jgi:hypothetical protein
MPQKEVLLSRQSGKELPAFRHECYSHPCAAPRWKRVDALAFVEELPLHGPHQAAESAHDGGLPGPVGAYQGNNIALLNTQADPPQHLGIAIAGVHFAHF